MTTPASRTDASGTTPPSALSPITTPSGPRAAAERAVSNNSVTIHIGGQRLELPPLENLAFLVGLGAVVALDLLEWPVALAIGIGHQLAHSNHGKVLREFGEALEEA